MDRQLTFEILLYLNMYYTMFYAGIQTIFFFMKYLYVPDFGKNIMKITQGWLPTLVSGCWGCAEPFPG